MKKALLMVVAVSFGATACVGAPDDEDTAALADEEMVGEATDELNQTDTMGAIPWGEDTGWTSDLAIFHQVNNVQGKQVTVQAAGDFPTLTGAYTPQKLADCQNAYIDVLIYKRSSGSAAWGTPFQQVRKYATAHISGFPLQITDCFADFYIDDCDAIAFSATTTQMKVEVGGFGGGTFLNPKISIVRRPQINLANC
jgi:hypothetical protein